MAPTVKDKQVNKRKDQCSRSYYKRKVERALSYLHLACEFEQRCNIGQSSASTTTTMAVVKLKNQTRRFGKVSCFFLGFSCVCIQVFQSSSYLKLLIFVSFAPHPHSPTKVVDVIQVPRCVSYIYEAIGRTSLTGGGTHSMCYGEITCPSLHSLWLECLRLSLIVPGVSALLELGSGKGKPSFHFSSFFRCLAVGIEIDYPLYLSSMSNLKKIYCKADKLGFSQPQVSFVHDSILSLTTFDPFTIVYAFDRLFEPELLHHIAKVFNASTKCQVFITYQKPSILTDFGFCNLKLQTKILMTMVGSGEKKTCYVYTRRLPMHQRSSNSPPDPLFSHLVSAHSKDTLLQMNSELEVETLFTPRTTRSKA